MNNDALRRRLARLVIDYERAYNAGRAGLAGRLLLEIEKLMLRGNSSAITDAVEILELSQILFQITNKDQSFPNNLIFGLSWGYD